MSEVTTIAIPTIKGREDILLNCLVSIVGQCNKSWDLMICTTNPEIKPEDRDTLNPLNNFLRSIEHLGHKVTILYDEKKTGPGTAVQQIIDNCDSEYILRVDDDVILTSDVHWKLGQTITEHSDVVAVAAPVNGFGARFVNYQRYWSSKAPHLIGNGNYHVMNDNFTHHSCFASQAIAEVDFLSGYCLMFHRETFVEAGGYADKESPLHHKEDWYATLKLRSLGHRLLVRADAVAFHNHYKQDESDRFRASRSKEDHELFNKFKKTIKLPDDRRIGIVDYEA